MFQINHPAVKGAFVASLVSLIASGANAETTADKIKRARTAAPPDISDNATFLDLDGTLLQQGTNGWVCFPGIPLIPGDTHPMCNDAVWMKWMEAISSGGTFTTDVIGISYMLAGDAMVNNADPMATDHNDGGVWVQEGPHLMILFPDKDMVAGLPNDPYAGGPYVMWSDTPLWHVMVPIEAKDAP
ncbi:hypothetical protein SAMN05443999_102199 [Roseovarius azorensis]|uniref:Uncharacterized protein n=1 Tax=Roseovarius azorensis TaxID=1287727 RepID=A0A1H7JME7_9RHOB|nr:hypothetical protein [Roseovarius azorensis]SEK75702.1 hypothetical protein SAMN05443999_102199 [Roseovarius azorensis]